MVRFKAFFALFVVLSIFSDVSTQPPIWWDSIQSQPPIWWDSTKA